MPMVARGVGTSSRVGTVSTAIASQESNGDGIEFDNDDESFADDYDEDQLDTDDDEVEELKVGKDRHQQQQQHRRRGDQHQPLQPSVFAVRRETNVTSRQGVAGGSVPPSPTISPIGTVASRVRTSGGDSVAHGTSMTESGASSEGDAGISREQWIERERLALNVVVIIYI